MKTILIITVLVVLSACGRQNDALYYRGNCQVVAGLASDGSVNHRVCQ